MAGTIKIKRSAVAGKVPTTTDLDLGELALNTYDGKLYTKKSVSGVESIVDLSSAAGEVRCDASAVTTIYVGRAQTNTAETSSGWTITKTTYSSLGVLLTTTTASGAWSNRTTLIYS